MIWNGRVSRNARTEGNGELAVRRMSEKAQEGYELCGDSLAVYEDTEIIGEDDLGFPIERKMYCIKDCNGIRDYMTMEQAEEWLEEMADIFADIDDDGLDD